MSPAMPPLVSLSEVSKSYGARPLFSKISFTIEPGERIGFIGPNGAGKSTLLNMIAGNITPDSGTIAQQRGLRLGLLAQMPLFTKGATVMQTLLEASLHPDDNQTIMLAYELIAKLDLCDSDLIKQLSGGWKKRVALARELMREPDLLLLDEPTNHLDVESILWLEQMLAKANFATLTITHDRYFLQKVANRIIELDKRNPGGLLSIKGNYQAYLYSKDLLMQAQEKQETTMRNTLRREQEWLARGPQARSTKQHARIERAYELADQVSELEYRNYQKTAGIEFESTGNKPKKLIEAKQISKAYGDKVLFSHLDLLLSPGTCLGLLGNNGCGKSSLINVLLGRDQSDTGSVFRSDHLQVAYFEQNRESLDPETTVAKTLAPSGDQVIYRGNPVHVRGYLDRFLFTALQANMPVRQLSGGEQSRLLLARLMLQDANILVLDEPTNDLDLATLNILEECLVDFSGAIILVTHDRYFLDRVASKILAFHPAYDGRTEYFVELSQWQTWYEQEKKFLLDKSSPTKPPVKVQQKQNQNTERERAKLELKIEKAEQKLKYLEADAINPEYATNSAKLMEIHLATVKVQAEIDQLYVQWNELA